MSGIFDPRQNPKVQEILESVRGLVRRPFVHPADLREAQLVLQALPELDFPINSASELVDKLERSGRPLEIVGVKVDAAGLVHYMPAHYFPIVSLENFIEKIAELIRQNRKKVNLLEELASIKAQLPQMNYPIVDVQELVRQLGPNKLYRFQGSSVEPQRIAHRIVPDIFPIVSQEDFDRKISDLMVNRPLIIGHQ